eukprot:160722_1
MSRSALKKKASVTEKATIPKSEGALYYTGFGQDYETPPPERTCPKDCCLICGDKCNALSKDPLKLALVIGTTSLLISLVSTILTATVVSQRILRLEEYPQTFGITNINETFSPGGYYGWYYHSSYPDLYPLADMHVSIGDTILFTSRVRTSEDLWLVPREVYESCNFTNKTDQIQLAVYNWLRGGTYDANETCDDCDQGWHMVKYKYNEDGGHKFLIQRWHIKEYGNPLYFASAREWDRWDDPGRAGCRNGIKLRVFIEPRKAIPILDADASELDIASTETVQDLMASIGHLSRMLILSQFNFEQRIRSEGDSGLTTVRGNYDGDAAYDDGTYTNGAVASIHDHANNIIVVGIGEIGAVLNGVEFNTRHNDYNLMMPSEDDDSYGATQEIDSPPVPPEVSGKATVAEEVAEMQEWFRAFGTQNLSHRNYSAYFKPILCYLEGVWIMDDEVLEEPFASDRHAIDARSWKQLHDKIRWMSNSGRKNSLENLAHLPSSIRNLLNDTYPVISNWEYRILCAPMANDIGTARFRIVNDLSVQLMGAPETRDELEHSRRARFELNRDLDDNNLWNGGRKRWNYLDHLMEQIPGKNNYGANLTDVLPDGSDMCIHYMTDEVLNSAYYSRYFGLSGKDAMGSVKHRRGWSDRNLFAAQTTHTKVSPIAFNFEETDEDGKIVYIETESRWSYAIPLEIIYQTPISKWNPYGVEYVDRSDYDYTRSGDCEGGLSEAFDGWTINNAYFTPAEFYEGLTTTGAADTHADNVCAIGKDGAAHSVYASGHWISFPEIGNGVGRIRQRYPIFPIHAAGSAPFKETKALQSVVLDDDYDDTETNPDGFFGDNRDKNYGFEINLNGGGHQHVMYVSGWRVTRYWYHQNGTELSAPQHVITAESDTRNSHAHTVELWRQMQDGQWIYNIARCRLGSISDADQYGDADWTQAKCHDNHNSLQRFG